MFFECLKVSPNQTWLQNIKGSKLCHVLENLSTEPDYCELIDKRNGIQSRKATVAQYPPPPSMLVIFVVSGDNRTVVMTQ